MTTEESFINRRLYKITLIVLKVIPMLLALCTAINTVFGLSNIDNALLSYLGGVSFLPLLFLYLTSYVLYDCGFTFSKVNEYSFINKDNHRAVLLIGPTSSGAEFLDSLVHEIHHLAVAIAGELGVELDSETPAYLSGDTIREFADIVCELGCDRCRDDIK